MATRPTNDEAILGVHLGGEKLRVGALHRPAAEGKTVSRWRRAVRITSPPWARLALAAVLVVAPAVDAAPAESPAAIEDVGDFQLRYEAPRDQRLESARELVRSRGVFEELVAELNDLLALPHDIAIRFEEDSDGPYYAQRAIVIDYGFVVDASELFEDAGYSETEEERAQAVLDLTEFVLYHEVGHALIEAYSIPILGREEDAVDSLAALVSAYGEDADSALVAVDAFDLATRPEKVVEEPYWAGHSLGRQRMYNLLCLLYGSDPQAYEELLEESEMPGWRKQECVDEYEEKLASWGAVLGPYMKRPPRRGSISQ